jgi:Ca2+-binding EF-hand superfamily protein
MKTMTGTIAVAAAAALCAGTLALAAGNAHHAAAGGQHPKWQPGQGWDHFVATFDTNKDGKVSKDELMAKAPGFDHMDANKDGVVTADEIKALPASTKHPQMGSNFMAKFDTDKDGKVTKQEWDAKRTAGFDAADKNHDGAIDKDEYTSGAQELAGSM